MAHPVRTVDTLLLAVLYAILAVGIVYTVAQACPCADVAGALGDLFAVGCITLAGYSALS